ncbi:hypothetical protein ACFVTC_15530 [Streptomyces sp. NPDC057950]|uniref:hypothetical protein n=1 Tax=Streptomyces sp. NPDC057950 TaxID=3346288 RepID=UPI0036E52CB3
MLLVHDGESAPDAPGWRTGGVPLAPGGIVWPVCRECGGAMQFLAHLPVDGGVVAVFFCQNDPGMCDDWDAGSGANQAFLFTGDLTPVTVPAEGETRLRAVTALRPHPAGTAPGVPVLGQLGGAPEWLQGDETPACTSCAARMVFAASLAEGHDFATAANFGGGGRGYLFTCRPCAEAAFLWQR